MHIYGWEKLQISEFPFLVEFHVEFMIINFKLIVVPLGLDQKFKKKFIFDKATKWNNFNHMRN